jgi:aminoglycoside 6'-N-acetyltransferase I
MSTTARGIVRIKAGSRHLASWLALRRRLWPHLSAQENAVETGQLLRRGNYAAWIWVDEDGRAAGFAEAGLRDYAEGCETSPVGYLEGWYVLPERRGLGIGRKLVEAAENWARERGMREMASDAELDNLDSQRAHARLGYSETGRVVSFRKPLD